MTIRQLRVLSIILFSFLIALGAYLFLSNQDTNDDPVPINQVGHIINRPLTNFTLNANDGSPLSLTDLHGQYVLLSFGYTHCPDVCPTTMLEFRRIKQALGERSTDFTFAFISVDEQRDTPDILDRFVRRFDPEFIGLQGESTVLEQMVNEFDLSYSIRPNPDSEGGYLVDHTASKYLISPDGNLIRIYSFAADASDVAAELMDLR